ncbi:YgjP-like metallopeptidase domain-containing protein [uncultured Clostridium sp.]|nr:YgjP-like metallopeptidase domain-containing protein [uncultured Clostridium sp.]
MVKATALDYIVVHEMCHMYYKNNSQVVGSVMSYYENRKEWLRLMV